MPSAPGDAVFSFHDQMTSNRVDDCQREGVCVGKSTRFDHRHLDLYIGRFVFFFLFWVLIKAAPSGKKTLGDQTTTTLDVFASSFFWNTRVHGTDIGTLVICNTGYGPSQRCQRKELKKGFYRSEEAPAVKK